MRLCLKTICAVFLAAWSAGVAAAFSGANALRCVSRPTSTFIVRPSDARDGETTSLLLSCHTSELLGFEGSFGPTGLVLYTETAFKKLRDVQGFYRPARVGSHVGPPIRPNYDIVGPDEIALKVPPGLAAGAYVVVIDDGRADVVSQNLLDVR
jgi:hypothetical protein